MMRLYHLAEILPTDYLPVFNDIPANHEFGAAVAWAYHNDIAQGNSENCFAPDDPITREELSTMLS